MRTITPIEKELLAWVKQQKFDASLERSLRKRESLNDRSYTDILRGVEVVHDHNPFPRQPCSCTMTDDGEHGHDCIGRWLRTLNSQGTCYLYVHTITHEIRGSKPPGFQPLQQEDSEREKKILAARGGVWHAFPSCHIMQWKSTVAAIAAEGRTPLLLADDPKTYQDLVSQFAGPDGAELVDTRPFVLPASRTGIKFDDHFATMVARVTAALKSGKPAVLDLQDNSPNWLEKLCGVPKYGAKFPEQVFNPKAHGWQKDLVPNAAPGFVLVLLTTLSPKEYERELKDKLPWHLIRPIRVITHIPAEHVHLADLNRALDSAKSKLKVPLLLDETPEHAVDTFLAYQHAQQIDVPQLLLSARTVEEMREVLRAKLVACMKAGIVLLMRLKDSTPDFVDKYCSDDSFPLAVFSATEITTDKWLKKLFKDSEKEHGVSLFRDGFRVILSSWRPVATFGTDLGAGLPLHMLDVWAVEVDPEVA